MPIRAGTAADIAAIGHLHAVSRRTAYRDLFPPGVVDGADPAVFATTWAARFAAEQATHRMLVDEDDGALVGFAYVGPENDLGMLFALHVHPRRHGTGRGRALLRAAESLLRDLGHRRAYLYVLEGNTRARRFYERAGWYADGAATDEPMYGMSVHCLRYTRELAEWAP